MPIHQFEMAYADYGIDPARGGEFCDLLLEDLLDRQPDVMWQRVVPGPDGRFYAAVHVDGDPRDAAAVLAAAMTRARFALEAVELRPRFCVQRDRGRGPWRHADPHTCPMRARAESRPGDRA